MYIKNPFDCILIIAPFNLKTGLYRHSLYLFYLLYEVFIHIVQFNRNQLKIQVFY